MDSSLNFVHSVCFHKSNLSVLFQLYAAQFSQCGRFLATVCKDGRIRIFDPRTGSEPVIEGAEIVPKKGARIVWAMDGKFLIVTGFSRYNSLNESVLCMQKMVRGCVIKTATRTAFDISA